VFVISLLCLFTSFFYNYYNVYAPMRTRGVFFFVSRILLVNAEATALSILTIYLLHEESVPAFFSWVFITVVLSSLFIVTKKIAMISFLRSLRMRRRNIKHVLLVTDSQEMVDAYMEEILNNPQFGYSVIGYVGNTSVIGLPHLGTTGDLDRLLKELRPDEVVMAFDTVRKKLITKYITICNNNCVKIMVVPAICGYFRSPRQVTELGNMPLIDIRSTPLDKFSNQILKRVTDIVGSLILIILTSPLMLFTAIGVKLSHHPAQKIPCISTADFPFFVGHTKNFIVKPICKFLDCHFAPPFVL
jgi:FlaA1/EpsC-like NDP-sugar epimerase